MGAARGRARTAPPDRAGARGREGGLATTPGAEPEPEAEAEVEGRRRSRAPRGEGDRLRAEILAVTGRLLVEMGDEEAVSIRAIAEAVGVTPPSIYMHFADKDELVRAVSAENFTRFHEELERAVAGVDDPVEALRRRGHAYVRYGVESPEPYRILFMGRARQDLTREDFEAGNVPGAPAFMGLVGNVAACMDRGAFARRDPFLVATGLWALVHGVTSLRVSAPNFPGINDDAFVDHALAMAANGLALEG